jgi:fatty-acyl-CoA synthase
VITGYADWFQRWAEVAPGRTAIREVETGRSLSYGRLSERGWRLYHGLAALGVRPGDRVALLARNGTPAFELLVACLRLGAAYMPLNWRLAGAELADIVTHGEPRVLVYDEASAEQAAIVLASAPELRGVALGAALRAADASYEALIAGASAISERVERDAEALAMLLYTSGTTGRPKGVMVPHRQLLWNAVNTVWATDLGPQDRALACLPLFHTGGLNCLATPTLYRGGTVVLMAAFDADRALDTIARDRVTITVAVPTMYQMLVDAGLDRSDLSSLHTLLCGGAPCPLPLLDAWLDRGFNFRQGFGMTEVGPNCFSLPPAMSRRKKGSVGQSILHGEAAVFGDDGQRLGPGEVGELRLRGPHVCAGYWRAPEETAAVLRDGWLCTGDLARRDEDGFFYVAGRQKDMFISGGENVYPAEIENVLLGLDGVAEVAVVGVPDPRWGEVGLAALVLRPGASRVDAERARSHCAERLARFKVPKRFEIVDALPKNASGKVMKPAVRALFTD